MKKNVLIVGAGRRAHAVVLPALHCLQDQFTITSIHTRTPRTVSIGGGAYTIHTRQGFEDIDFKSVDIIILVIPPEQVKSVLQSLIKKDMANVTLFVDTPVVDPRSLGALRYMDPFKKVLVAEDLIALPPIVLMKKMVREGNIGVLKYIHLFHGGFKHHALATLKFLTNTSYVRCIVSQKIWGEVCVKDITMPGSVRVTMFEPRDYAIEKTFMAGTRGAIANYPIALSGIYYIEYLSNGGRYAGLSLDGNPLPQNALDTAYAAHIAENTTEVSLMNDLKIRGYMELLYASGENKSEYHYTSIDAVYDNLVIKWSDKFGFFFDIGWGNFSVIKSLIRIVSFLMP